MRQEDLAAAERRLEPVLTTTREGAVPSQLAMVGRLLDVGQFRTRQMRPVERDRR